MTIEILTGLPGTGKSERLITKVQSARSDGITALIVCCSESLVLQRTPSIAEHQRISSRSGLVVGLDRFESTEEAIGFLGAAKDGWLLAFEEAQYFGTDIVDAWCDASNRGVSILIATPSKEQLALLTDRGHVCTNLTLSCQKCGKAEATKFFCYSHEDRTKSVCECCYREMKCMAEEQIVSRLVAAAPHPGREIVYQPVGLPACEQWEVIREDSSHRFQLVKAACDRVGLPSSHSSYLDVGCNTGFFCHQMSQIGFNATGVDVVETDIQLARLLSTYCRRDYVNYTIADAYEYLASSQDIVFDVASAFSVFQWVMIQQSAQHGLHCMNWLFQKAKYLCVLEVGESAEDHYVERIGMRYDSQWIYSFMKTSAVFDAVEVYEAAQHGLKRDLFIGFTHAGKRRMAQ